MERPVLLMIEDEKDIRLLYKSILSRHFDWEIIEADSLKSANLLLSEERPQFVLLDMCLPDGSGCEIIPKIKSSNPEAKILVITAFGHCKETREATDLGAFAMLEKPFKMAAFIEHLQEMQK